MTDYDVHDVIWVDYSPYTETYGRIEYSESYGDTPYIRKAIYDATNAGKSAYKLKLEVYTNRLNIITNFIEDQLNCNIEGINNDDLPEYLRKVL
jgi:hypothetical protein